MQKVISLFKNPRVLASATAWLMIILTIGLRWTGVGLPLLIPLYLTCIVIGGYFFAREGVEKLFEKRKIGIDFLMTVGTIGAVILGEWFEALILVGLYSISEAIEDYTVDKTRKAIRALMDLVPKKALVKRNGKEEIIPAEALEIGEIFIVKAGESIATDGVIKKGSASVNQAPITGESIPIFKQVNEQVFSGTINENGLIEVEVTKPFTENTIAKIIHLVEEAQKAKGRKQFVVEKFSNTFSPAVLGISLVMPFILPSLGFSLSDAFIRAITFVVAAAPCALAISVPVAFAAALGTSARSGVLVKGGIYLEELAETKMIAFDKTGTLTTGQPKLLNAVPLNNFTHGELLAIAGSLVFYSSHPLDKAIQEHIKEENIKIKPCQNLQSLTGEGLKGDIEGKTFYLGSPELFRKLGHNVKEIFQYKKLSTEGKTVVFIGTKDKLFGLLAIADTARVEAEEVIKELHNLGIHSIMLTGDNELVGKSIGQKLGIDTVFAELKPEEKVAKIKELKKAHKAIAMIGDGVNDAPALAESSVGIAMGTAGTDAALEAANVALMGDDLRKIAYGVKLARFAKKIVLQNLVFSVLLLMTTMTSAIFMLLSISQIIFIHEFGEVLVILNGLRLLKGRV